MEQLGKNEYLGEKGIGKLIFKFAFPCVISLLISSLYNLVDQIFVGNSKLGYLGNGATGVVFPVIVIAQAFAWFFGDGSAAYLSICQGRKDTERASKAIGTCLSLSFIASLILAICSLVFMTPMLKAFGGTENTLPLAKEYLFILLWFFPAFMLVNTFQCLIRADGSPIFSMVATGVGAVANIALDPLFIYTFDMGMKGAAIATVIGQVLSFIVCALYLPRTKTFKLTWKTLIPDFKNAREAFELGISSLITDLAIVVVSLTCNRILSKYGASSKYGVDIPISIMAIQTKVFTIVVNIVVGVVLGSQPIIGYNFGAKKIDRVKKTYLYILIISIITGLIFTAFFVFYPQGVLRLFGSIDDPLYYEFGTTFFRIFLSTITLCCLIKMSCIFFQSIGHPIKAIITSLVRDLLIFVPMMILLPYIGEKNNPGQGIMYSLYSPIIADVVAFIVCAILTILLFKEFDKIEKETKLNIENN